jgi:hypothetical protein
MALPPGEVMPVVVPAPARIPSVSWADDPVDVPTDPALTPVLPTSPVDVATPRPPAEPPPTQQWWQDHIQVNVPLPKVQRCSDTADVFFPAGSIFDPDGLARPPLPSTPFDFPFPTTSTDVLADAPPSEPPDLPSIMDSVTHVVGLPRVCGLLGDSAPCIKSSTSLGDATLVDSGANICVTGLLETLVDVVSIPALPISVAVHGSNTSLDDCCTHRGLLPLTMEDGSVFYQPCYFCKNVVETIISPQAIVAGSDVFISWQQTGYKDGTPGRLRFYSDSGLASMTLSLEKRDGLYYAPTDVYTVDHNPVRSLTPRVRRIVTPPSHSLRRPKQKFAPVTKSNQTESELWMLRLGSPGEHQLDLLPGNVTGIPSVFEYHPFRFLDFKEQARIRKQAAQRSAVRTSDA